MRSGGIAKVAVVVDGSATQARHNLNLALRLESCEAVDIPVQQFRAALLTLNGYTAMVYDLSPFDAEVPSILRECWLRFPDLPLLLYVPAAPNAGKLLTAIREIPTVTIELQLEGSSEPRRLQSIFRDLIGRSANVGFRRIINDLLKTMPSSLRTLAERRIEALETGRALPPLTIGSLALQSGVTLRRIEQLSRAARLPAPRVLLDQLTLLWLAFGARQRGISTARFARERGLSPERLYRLRRRLIGHPSDVAVRDPTGELTTIFHHMVRACHLPSRSRQGVPGTNDDWMS